VVSADHHATSVRLMVDHLETHCRDGRLAAHVTPRQPWRSPRSERRGLRWKDEHIAELQDVAAMVRALEVRRQGVPVLLEQYLKLGARVVGTGSGAQGSPASPCLMARGLEAMQLLIVIEKTHTGFSAYSPDLQGHANPVAIREGSSVSQIGAVADSRRATPPVRARPRAA
jgi:hypothetical protein